MLGEGYHDVANGMLATVVTHLEMKEKVAPRPVPQPECVRLVRQDRPSAEWYGALFRRVGAEDWLWFSRLRLAAEALEEILHDPDVTVFSVERDGEALGLLELDFRQENECELAFFGLAAPLIGGGVGRWLMNNAIEQAWSRQINRFHLHTCTLDHPAALAFYQRSGFTPYRRQVEIARDPRLAGELPESCGAHIPMIR